MKLANCVVDIGQKQVTIYHGSWAIAVTLSNAPVSGHRTRSSDWLGKKANKKIHLFPVACPHPLLA